MLLSNYQQAIDAFQKFRSAREAENPPYRWTKADAELFWRTANCMEALKDSSYWSQIADNYKRALELDPDDQRSLSAYATTLHKLARYAEAAVEFDKLVQKNTGDARTLFNASLPYLESDNNQKAVELLLKAADADTSADAGYRSRAYKLAGPRLIKMGRTAEAQKCYRWLVEREPDVCDHRQWYGFTLFSTKDYKAAVPHLQKAYKCNEQQGGNECKFNELRWWLGYALYEVGQKDDAYKLLEQVVKCSPSHADAKSLMARIDEEIVE
jgi:tetratricopeptide (TPR) repeat protein